jgi:hypothetical protein
MQAEFEGCSAVDTIETLGAAGGGAIDSGERRKSAWDARPISIPP